MTTKSENQNRDISINSQSHCCPRPVSVHRGRRRGHYKPTAGTWSCERDWAKWSRAPPMRSRCSRYPCSNWENPLLFPSFRLFWGHRDDEDCWWASKLWIPHNFRHRGRIVSRTRGLYALQLKLVQLKSCSCNAHPVARYAPSLDSVSLVPFTAPSSMKWCTSFVDTRRI